MNLSELLSMELHGATRPSDDEYIVALESARDNIMVQISRKKSSPTNQVNTIPQASSLLNTAKAIHISTKNISMQTIAIESYQDYYNKEGNQEILTLLENMKNP